MAITENITCDVCGTQKGEANHWMLWRAGEIVPGVDGKVGGVQFAPWHPELYHLYRHLCGESCAARLLSRSIEDWQQTPGSLHAERPAFRVNTSTLH